MLLVTCSPRASLVQTRDCHSLQAKKSPAAKAPAKAKAPKATTSAKPKAPKKDAAPAKPKATKAAAAGSSKTAAKRRKTIESDGDDSDEEIHASSSTLENHNVVSIDDDADELDSDAVPAKKKAPAKPKAGSSKSASDTYQKVGRNIRVSAKRSDVLTALLAHSFRK